VIAARRATSNGPIALRAARALLARRASGKVVLFMVAVAGCLYVMRRPTSIFAPVLFADDGIGYVKGAIEHGWTSLLETYAAQVFLFQRALALAFSVLPVAIQPAAYMAAAVAAAVGSCSIVLSAHWRPPVPVVVRFACLVALLSSPAVDEIFGSFSNIHWWLGVGAILLVMLRDPVTRRTKRAEYAFVAASAVSATPGSTGCRASLFGRSGCLPTFHRTHGYRGRWRYPAGHGPRSVDPPR
jgi:hypothetical protein